MVFNRLPPFKSILELLSLISTLCVFRFLFFGVFLLRFRSTPIPRDPSKDYGFSLIQMLLRIQIRLHLSLFNFQGPARSPLSRTAYILYHTFLCLSICFFAFFRGFSGPLSPASLVRQLCYYNKPLPTCQHLFQKFFLFLFSRFFLPLAWQISICYTEGIPFYSL